MLQDIDTISIGNSFYNRFTTDGILPAFDTLMGGDINGRDGKVIKGGIVPGGIYMINGAAGCGKSTAMMTIADALGQTGLSVAYVTTEEDSQKLAFDCVERLDLRHFMVGAMTDFDEILNQFVVNGINVGFIDSIADAVVSRKVLIRSGKRRDEYITDRLKEFKLTHGITVFLVNHLTKAGNYRGSSKILHGIDVMMWLVYADQEIYSPDMRDMYCSKNRYGPTDQHIIVKFGSDGYDFEENHWMEGSVVTDSKVNKHDLKKRIRIQKLKQWVEDGGNTYITVDDHNVLEMKRAAFAMFMKELEDSGVISRDGKDGRKVRYVLSDDDNPEDDDTIESIDNNPKTLVMGDLLK